ncbi:hypothetical protein ES319_A11G130200v1 [Gossypium barbadense]|uniref:Uncharacterized protein n=2 Tax=Gossypium TaxID=3633 RepID=A0A5J5TMN0_GOSBA|nr:hypothetical protein ES319_A11G130200v1 [Gossypium barbadense]TYG93791.1 hypothetical protein ES288_A11G139100v1 [Gossypium darwinii]
MIYKLNATFFFFLFFNKDSILTAFRPPRGVFRISRAEKSPHFLTITTWMRESCVSQGKAPFAIEYSYSPPFNIPLSLKSRSTSRL